MKIGLLGGILAALLGGLGFGGSWDDDDRRVCPESGVCAPHRPPPDEPRVCPDDGPCAPHLPPPARRS